MQHKDKAPGPDGIKMEAYLYAGLRLNVHLAQLFNLFVSHSYLPTAFMDCVIIPLVKNKSGDLTDANNYRAIALSNVITKILEAVLSPMLTTTHDADAYQFGFKAGHSTTLCTHMLKSTVQYYTSRGSNVFACFIDFSKAFDMVNYWKLFSMLLDDKVETCIVELMAFWYSNQNLKVCWLNVQSSPFKVSNGTRQGSLISPYLFSRYIRGVVAAIVSSRIGCNIGGKFINILCYADDMVLIAPSWHALQCLLNLLALEIALIDMTCNIKKTCCMIFRSSSNYSQLIDPVPHLTMNGVALNFVNSFKYLGHIICNTLGDNADINCEIRNMYIRANVLVRRFGKCSRKVKCKLFRSFCLCIYGAGLWCKYFKNTKLGFRTYYHRFLKIIFGLKKYDSTCY